LHITALRLGEVDILNADFGIFPTGTFSVPEAGISFTYSQSMSGLDVLHIDGSLPEQLFIRVS